MERERVAEARREREDSLVENRGTRSSISLPLSFSLSLSFYIFISVSVRRRRVAHRVSCRRIVGLSRGFGGFRSFDATSCW